jgi:hypothetical protein
MHLSNNSHPFGGILRDKMEIHLLFECGTIENTVIDTYYLLCTCMINWLKMHKLVLKLSNYTVRMGLDFQLLLQNT